jgi:hypothetical protein
MIRRDSWRELKWIVPEESPDPPVELKRLFIQASETPTPPAVEDMSRGPYSEDDVEFILSSIKFGKQLTPEELQEIKELVVRRIAAFSQDDAEMGYTILIECEIDPTDTTPVQIRPYKLSFEEQREAAKIVEQLLKEKAIARSRSHWAAPAFLVPKPGGGWRLVTNLRILNSRCRDWKMPLPAIEDVFQKLGDAGLFCVMDITKGFWNVPISESSRKYTAFTLRNIGLFEYLVMPMGLKNSPATFVRLCQLVFPREDFKTFLQCFLDDLCVFCKGFEELLPALDKVLARVIFANLKLHPRESHLAVEEVDYLGHTIFKGGVKVSKKKSKAVRALLPPRTFKELQSLIGMFSYFRTFIRNFSKIARPLTLMLSP